MHSPQPYGLLINGDEPTERDSAFVRSLLLQMTNNKETYRLESLRIVRDLPDGGYVIVQHMGGLLKAIIKKPNQQNPLFIEGITHLVIPMLFSGMFQKLTYSIDEVFIPFLATEQTRKRLSGYKEISVPKQLNLNKFVVEYPPEFKYFEPEIKGDYFKHTQYMRLKPSWYSGAMAEVVQIVVGYGKPSNENFADDSIENGTFVLPRDKMLKMHEELKGHALPGYTGYAHEEGHIQYDYKQAKNDLISFDTDNKPWLVRVWSSGVYAMPLPIIPATTTETFRDYIESVDDDEILKILDRFGGMPSGETFPIGRGFDAWVRAGAVIKVCDAYEFYQYSPVYDASGWSINSNGTEGFNCCYTMTGGRVEFLSYKLKLVLGPLLDKGWIKPGNTDSKSIFNYISDIYTMIDVTDPYDRAIVYKIKRTDPKEIEERAVGYLPSDVNRQREYDYWENFRAKPIASHSGSVTRVGSGQAPMPIVKGNYQLNGLKFPAFNGEGCQSFQCPAPEIGERPTTDIACDVVVFGAYIDDQLKVIKYFREPYTFQQETQSTFEDFMVVGQWEETKTTSLSGIMGNFYTSDFDDRRELADSSVYTHIKGTDLGFGNPVFATPPLLYTHGTLSRARYYKHVIKTKSISSDSLQSAVCVPNLNRDAILYAYEQSTGSEATTEEHSKNSIADPTSYSLWTYDPIFHWIGSLGKGLPRPITGDYAYVYDTKYNPTEHSDFADQGDWYGVGSGYLDVSSIVTPYTDRASGNHHAGGVVIGGESPYMEPFYKKDEVKNKNSGYVSFSAAEVGALILHRDLPAGWYYYFSPQDDGAGGLVYFQRDCCRVMFGDSRYVNISDEGGSAGRRKFWGHTILANHRNHHYFFGVINE
ncbi:MAG: hypothetical protein RR767_05495 [Acinetobacter sp.]